MADYDLSLQKEEALALFLLIDESDARLAGVHRRLRDFLYGQMSIADLEAAMGTGTAALKDSRMNRKRGS